MSLLRREFKSGAKVDVSRFKGLGEMMPAQLKETTMRPGNRTPAARRDCGQASQENRRSGGTADGEKPELRFQFIQENAQFAKDVDVQTSQPPTRAMV